MQVDLSLTPHSGDLTRALGTRRILDAHSSNPEAVTFDEQFAATGTVRVFPIANQSWQIARVYKIQAFGLSNLGGSAQSAIRSVVRTGHFVVLVEGCDMPRNIGRNMDQESGDISKLFTAVVEARNDQGHNFEPKSNCVQPLDRVENVIQNTAKLAVIAILETLQVYLI